MFTSGRCFCPGIFENNFYSTNVPQYYCGNMCVHLVWDYCWYGVIALHDNLSIIGVAVLGTQNVIMKHHSWYYMFKQATITN